MESTVKLLPTMWVVFFMIDCLVVTSWTPSVPWRRNSQVQKKVKKVKMMRMIKQMIVVVKMD